MKIDGHIRAAIKKAANEAGNPYRLSLKLSGIRHTTIRDWLNGKTRSISDDNWARLRPILTGGDPEVCPVCGQQMREMGNLLKKEGDGTK